MAKGFDSSLTLWENNGWFDNGTSDPLIPILDGESLKRGLIINERNTMVRNSRAMFEDSLVTEESKPEGNITVIPRIADITPILYSHFQMKQTTDTGSSYLTDFVPSKYPPEFSTNEIYGNGTYGEPAGDAYSIDIWKKQADTDGSIDINTQQFKRGLCNKLTFSMESGDDLKVGAEFKFKGWGSSRETLNPGDVGAGSYSTGSITDWSHGTWNISSIYLGVDLVGDALSNINIECSNNLTEKKILGANARQTFDFGDYTVKGNFTSEWVSDIYQKVTESKLYFSISGTFHHTGTEYMIIDLPRCRAKPVESPLYKPNEFISVEVPFEAYEYQGTAPIKVTTNVPTDVIDTEFTFWDAGMGARTLSLYDFGDAGSTTRVLSEYDLADRDI